MKQDSDFRLSRVEAEGWNAAHRIMVDEAIAPGDIWIADFNPYRVDPARARWVTGFNNAIASGGRD
jgi:hypothetical protein